MVDDGCGYTGRMLTVISVTGAIIFSIVASFNCNFLKFENDSGAAWEGLEPPFNGALEAHVGIFGYEIIDNTDATMITDGCVSYNGKFGNADYEALIAAQFCALLAPLFGFFGLVVSCLDTCFCRFFCSFLISSVLFVCACGIQAGTFSLYAQPAFCYEGDQYCNVGISVYMSGASSALFFCGSIFLCCFPTPDPMFGKKTSKGPSSSRGGGQQVVVQPVVMDQRRNGYDEDDDDDDEDDESSGDDGSYEDEEEEEERRPPAKKNSMVSKNGDKITDDDFNFETPRDGTSRVETKERILADGTRRVDEITYHPDGRKTIKTKSYND